MKWVLVRSLGLSEKKKWTVWSDSCPSLYLYKFIILNRQWQSYIQWLLWVRIAKYIVLLKPVFLCLKNHGCIIKADPLLVCLGHESEMLHWTSHSGWTWTEFPSFWTFLLSVSTWIWPLLFSGVHQGPVMGYLGVLAAPKVDVNQFADYDP